MINKQMLKQTLFTILFIVSANHSSGFSASFISETNMDTCRIVVGWSEAEENTPLLAWMKKGGYVWGLELLHDVSEKRIRELYDEGWNIILYQLSHPEIVQRYYTQKKRKIPDVDETIKKFIKATDGNVIWQMILEDESCGVGLAQEYLTVKPETHKEAYEMMERYMQKATYATKEYDNIQRWSVAGYASTAHILAKQPEISLLSIERANDDVDDLQTGIAFFRGAGRQYNKYWGVDLSLWWGGIYGCVENLPYLYHKRHLFVSWYSGADHFRIEGSELFFDRKSHKPNRFTESLDQFGEFIKSHNRGVAEVPVAVIMPEDHGWITPPYWRNSSTAWNYAAIPYRQGQKALDGFFAAAFPGSNFYMDPFSFGKFDTEDPPASPFALSCISPEFAPNQTDVFNAEYPVPFGQFKNRNEAKNEMLLKQIETSLYRPMGDSRWGDIFDVFTPGVTADILSKYKVVVLLDKVEMDQTMILKLKKIMEGGATVVSAAGVLKPVHADFVGADIEPRLAVGQAWSFEGERMVNEPFRFLPARVTTGRAIATSSDGMPLIIEKSYGKGKLLSCMIPWFEGAPLPLSNLALNLFDKVITEVQPVKVAGLPIEFLSTGSKENYNVILSNNSGQDWTGIITAKSVKESFTTCTELLTDQKLSYERMPNGNVEVAVTIPPYEVRVISWSVSK